MKKKFKKIFIIGYNKTATSTLDALFNSNGWDTQHHDGLWEVDKKEVFSDQHAESTNSFDFKKLYRNYPEALFILNLRKLGDWIMSRCRHVFFSVALDTIKDTNRPIKASWAYPSLEDIYGDKRTLDINNEAKEKYFNFIKEKIKLWIDERQNYYKDILEFFKDKKNNLIIIDIYEKDWKVFIADHTMEGYIMTTDRMLASEGEAFNEITSLSDSDKKFYDEFMFTHKALVKKAIDEILSEYPSSAKGSVLLHEDEENKKFLDIYKNNFKK
ncbi:MAG: hypothetical protein CMM25_07870 [Rhodospirillaceae bacterium]|nr:hypothetical protein [Rhodospirillaceae bacterium]|tara:strand:- start:679 stop:1491 length:813 start_codon:yes stop_codon:yes gene_type:complete